MATTSAFAGSFNAAEFVTAVKETMKMGMPEDEAERLTFHWRVPSSATPASPAGSPYEWTQEPGEPVAGVPETSLQVDYAIEAVSASSTNTLAGTFENPRSTVTMLEEDYVKVSDSDYCTIGTSEYKIIYHLPVIGLFGVSVHQLVIQALDEA